MATPDCSAFEYCSFVPEPCPDARTKTLLQSLSYEAAARPLLFHQGLPGYRSTPLYELRALARELGLARIWIKDESARFGCNAFKAWAQAMPWQAACRGAWARICVPTEH